MTDAHINATKFLVQALMAVSCGMLVFILPRIPLLVRPRERPDIDSVGVAEPDRLESLVWAAPGLHVIHQFIDATEGSPKGGFLCHRPRLSWPVSALGLLRPILS